MLCSSSCGCQVTEGAHGPGLSLSRFYVHFKLFYTFCQGTELNISVVFYEVSLDQWQNVCNSVLEYTRQAQFIWNLNIAFYFKYIKICNVTKLLAYEIQTPLNEQTWLTSFSVTSVSNTRLYHLPSLQLLPLLFTDHLTIRVLNKNEVRKWLKITDHAEHAKQQQNNLWRRK